MPDNFKNSIMAHPYGYVFELAHGRITNCSVIAVGTKNFEVTYRNLKFRLADQTQVVPGNRIKDYMFFKTHEDILEFKKTEAAKRAADIIMKRNKIFKLFFDWKTVLVLSEPLIESIFYELEENGLV